MELLELDPDEMPQYDGDRWPEFKQRFAALFATRTANEWRQLLEGEETCVTVVRGLLDAHGHPAHGRARHFRRARRAAPAGPGSALQRHARAGTPRAGGCGGRACGLGAGPRAAGDSVGLSAAAAADPDRASGAVMGCEMLHSVTCYHPWYRVPLQELV